MAESSSSRHFSLSAEVCVKIHEGNKVGSGTGVLVVEGLMYEGAGEYLEFVL